MLGLPQQYAVGKPFEIGTFLTADLTPKEKKRFRDAAAAIVLAYQVAGESVPSRIDDTYDCQAILAFDVKVTALKEAAFVCGVIQRLVKPLCVVRAAGPNGETVYSFAHKRLHQADRTQAVVTDAIVTAVTLPGLRDDTADLLERYCSFDRLRNRTNKLGLYAEWMAKAYVVSHATAWSGSRGLLESKAWYNEADAFAILELFKRIVQLLKDRRAATGAAGQASINAELKTVYGRLGRYGTD